MIMEWGVREEAAAVATFLVGYFWKAHNLLASSPILSPETTPDEKKGSFCDAQKCM